MPVEGEGCSSGSWKVGVTVELDFGMSLEDEGAFLDPASSITAL